MSLAGRSATRPTPLAPEDTGDAVWIAQRMVLDAGAQAARLRRQASVQAATICAVAERETEMIWQQASAQAAALREAAERQAAELRAAVLKLSAGPGGLLTGDGSNVAGHDVVRLVGKPGTRTARKPAAAKPGTRTARKPAAEPGTNRAAEPGTRPARRPQGPPRQLMAVRVAAAATAALCLFALTAGTTELALHGFAFFVFRSGGTGETAGKETDQQFLAKQAAAARAATARAAAVKAGAVKAPAVKAPAVKAPAVKAPAVKAPAQKPHKPGRHPRG